MHANYTVTYVCQNGIEREYRSDAANRSDAVAEVFAECNVANIVKTTNNNTGAIDENA